MKKAILRKLGKIASHGKRLVENVEKPVETVEEKPKRKRKKKEEV